MDEPAADVLMLGDRFLQPAAADKRKSPSPSHLIQINWDRRTVWFSMSAVWMLPRIRCPSIGARTPERPGAKLRAPPFVGQGFCHSMFNVWWALIDLDQNVITGVC
jgi:hypothetical protein